MATNIFLRPGAVNPYNVVLRDPTQADSGAALEATQNELAAAIEAIFAEGLLYAAATETTTANDAPTAIGLALADCAETTAANDSPAAAIVAGAIEAGVDEQCAAADSSDCPGSIYGVVAAETTSAADANSATGGADVQASGGAGRARLYHFHNPRPLEFEAVSEEMAFARDFASATVTRTAQIIRIDRHREDEEIMLFAAGWR
jgi:hypothetical protein